MPEITALIRYKNSAETLPSVLSALQNQSLQPDRILAIDTGSTDSSGQLLRKAGADIIRWNKPYHHSQVLNFGINHCKTDLVLSLSAHTTILEKNGLNRLAQPLESTDVCASSIKWDDDAHFSDLIDWSEMKSKGMKIGSIYSNSLGLFRRELWERQKFDESINGMEDYDWVLYQLSKGFKVARLEMALKYQRNGHNREMRQTARASLLANRYGLKLNWLGMKGATLGLFTNLPGFFTKNSRQIQTFNVCRRRLAGALFWRFLNLNRN